MPANQNVGPATPFFIIRELRVSLEHYEAKLGFNCRYRAPQQAPFFAIIARGSAQIMLKAVCAEVDPLPNHKRHEWAPWDAFIYVAEPDLLADEYEQRGVAFHQPIQDTDDGLRGFEVADPDDYVCFFGRPITD